MQAFDAIRFREMLATGFLGRDFHYFGEIDSTNTWLKSMPGPLHGSVCLADGQTVGRGQYKRSWHSQPCCNLTWSVVFRPERHDRLFLLTLACMSAVADVVDRRLGGRQALLKWPNDLIVAERKVGGVLAEAVFNGNHLDRFVVGVGLNVNQTDFPSDLPDASSLCLVAGSLVDREELMAEILARTEQVYTLWEADDLHLVKTINERLIGYGQKVTAEVDGHPMPAPMLLLGIDAEGCLLLMDDSYTVHTYVYEQVRLHPVAG